MNDSDLRIPKFLHEFHGEKTNLFDILATYTAGVIISIVIFSILPDDALLWKQLLIVILALDIGGGVVANFTKSTTKYHQERPNLRKWFIAPMHLIHPALLVIAYSDFTTAIMLCSSLIIGSAYVVDNIKSVENQRVAASLLLIPVTASAMVFLQDSLVLTILITLFAIKLVLSYAVRWSN